MTIIKFIKNIKLDGYTVIIPSVSVGNVPQLTIDLLIANLNVSKAGLLWHPAIVPLVGTNPFDNASSEICTAFELFVDEKHKIALIQIRSGLEFKIVTKFVEDLKIELTQHKVSNIIILSSAFDSELHFIDGGKYFYIDTKENNKVLEDLNVNKMNNSNGNYIIPGGGFSMKLYEVMKESFHCLILFKYVSEGDNRSDALSLTQIISKYLEKLNIDTKCLQYPPSWAYVFGGPPPVGLY